MFYGRSARNGGMVMSDVQIEKIEEEVTVRRRIFRQLFESLIHEGLVHTQLERTVSGRTRFSIRGCDASGQDVWYTGIGKVAVGFGRVRLTGDPPVFRQSGGENLEAACFGAFLQEIAPSFKAKIQRCPAFVEELQHTYVNDVASRCYWKEHPRTAVETLACDELENEVIEGHPYHPCYKSRMGWDEEDQQAYAPEFRPRFRLIWVAMRQAVAVSAFSPSLDRTAWLRQELGDATYKRFCETLQQRGHDPDDDILLPVHPWQWREVIACGFLPGMEEADVVFLGESEDVYQPQQSIRTLSNATAPEKCYVKTALSMTNTSARRIIAPHHVKNAPVVSEWLAALQKKDRFLQKECRLVFLKEIAAVSYDVSRGPAVRQEPYYGALGAIWRESLLPHLQEAEQAVPFTALCHRRPDGTPFIEPWIRQYGLQPWVRQVLQVTILPLLHLLYAHGVALEAHAQNMLLLHRKGFPQGVVLRDLPGGLCLYDVGQEIPDLEVPGDEHVNASSSMKTVKAHDVRDFWMDGLLHINLYEWAMFLEEHYALPETDFWLMIVELIRGYEQRFPEYKDRFEAFDLFADRVAVGRLTARRLCGEEEGGEDHFVANPLAAVEDDEQKGWDRYDGT